MLDLRKGLYIFVRALFWKIYNSLKLDQTSVRELVNQTEEVIRGDKDQKVGKDVFIDADAGSTIGDIE